MIRGHGCTAVRLAFAVAFVVGTVSLTGAAAGVTQPAAAGSIPAAQSADSAVEQPGHGLDDRALAQDAGDIDDGTETDRDEDGQEADGDQNGDGNEADSDQSEDGNETQPIRHRNPDQYGAPGDLDRLEGWLEGRLHSQLEGSAIELSEGEADLAREYLDEEYRERLGQYVEVTGETDSDGNAETFEDARDEQERLVETVDEYEEQKEAYERAREEGDDEQAREHARNLEALWSDIDDTSHELDASYDAIGEETGADLSAADDAVDEVHRSIETDQEDVRDEQFLETELTVESDESNISFLEPLTATGELQTTNETAVADEEIQLEIDNATERVETDANGTFELEYRPTTLPLETDELPIEFVPDGDSEYLGSETSVTVSVDQTEPNITALDAPDDIAYRDDLPVSGAISVEDEPVDDVQLSVTLDGEALGVVHTSNGSFEGSLEVPETVPDGEQELEVLLGLEDRALAQTNASETVTVRETETEMAVNATRLQSEDLRVDGTLETADGTALENESVQLRVAGTPVETVDTDGEGEFAATVDVPSSANSTVTVDARYDDPGSNLASAEAEADVTFPGGDGTTLRNSLWLWLGLGAVGTVVVGGAWWYRQSSSQGVQESSTPDAVTTTPEQRSETDGTLELLSAADDRLSSGQPDEAVQMGYAAVRRTLGTTIRAGGLTHWEFYHRLRQLDDEPLTENQQEFQEFLYDLTAEYERAAFTPESPSEQTAGVLLERARQFCEREQVSANGDTDATSE